MGTLIIAYFIFSLIKYFLVFFGVINVNKAIHEDMIMGIMRSPSSYFDITSSGQLHSKISNDLGVIDNLFQYVFSDSVEGPIISLIFIINVVFINIYFVIPEIIFVGLLIAGFIYFKNSIVAVKILEVGAKIPIFSMINEIAMSLIQVRIYQRKLALLN